MVRMQGWKNGEGGLGCTQRGAHGLCLFRANKEVTLVTRRMSVRGWKTLRECDHFWECEGIRWSYEGCGILRGIYGAFMTFG